MFFLNIAMNMGSFSAQIVTASARLYKDCMYSYYSIMASLNNPARDLIVSLIVVKAILRSSRIIY